MAITLKMLIILRVSSKIIFEAKKARLSSLASTLVT